MVFSFYIVLHRFLSFQLTFKASVQVYKENIQVRPAGVKEGSHVRANECRFASEEGNEEEIEAVSMGF